MKKYTKADVSEQELEDIVRRNAGQIEEDLIYVDHQKPAAGGRLDVLLACLLRYAPKRQVSSNIRVQEITPMSDVTQNILDRCLRVLIGCLKFRYN